MFYSRVPTIHYLLFLEKCELTSYKFDKCYVHISEKHTKTYGLIEAEFFKNGMVFNPDKHSFILFGLKDELQTNFVNYKITIRTRKEDKVLGITIDNKRGLSTYLSSITNKTIINVNGLTNVKR